MTTFSFWCLELISPCPNVFCCVSVCQISPWPADGNITCAESVLARGNFIVKSGKRCHLGLFSIRPLLQYTNLHR